MLDITFRFKDVPLLKRPLLLAYVIYCVAKKEWLPAVADGCRNLRKKLW
jgi:hypothetical protein